MVEQGFLVPRDKDKEKETYYTFKDYGNAKLFANYEKPKEKEKTADNSQWHF